MEKEILKKINREILKQAKKGELYYYWNIMGIPKVIVSDIITTLEKEGKKIKSKGENYKIIMW